MMKRTLIFFRIKILLIVALLGIFVTNLKAEIVIDGETATFTLTDVVMIDSQGRKISGDDQVDMMPEDAAAILMEKLLQLKFQIINDRMTMLDQYDITTDVNYDASQSSFKFGIEENTSGLNQIMHFNAKVVDLDMIAGTFEYGYQTLIYYQYYGFRGNGRFEARVDWQDCSNCRIANNQSTNHSSNGGGCFIS